MRKWKKFIGVALACCMMLAVMTTAEAKNGNVKQDLEYKNIKVTLNGQALDLRDVKGNSVEPFMFNGTNYLPVRALSESLGLDVKWNSGSNTIQLSKSEALSQDESVEKMGYYKILEEGFQEVREIFSNFVTDMEIYTGSEYKEESQALIVASKDKVKNDLETAEGHYNNLKSDGLLTDDDISLMTEYRRLESQVYDDLTSLQGTLSKTQLQAIVVSAQQNDIDSLTEGNSANSAFWDTYQAAFE